MGWLSMTRDHMGPHPTPKKYLDAQFHYHGTDKDGLAYDHKVFASAMHGTTEYYAAILRTQPGKDHVIFAAVCMTFWNPKAKDGYIFGYKDMDETMGPNIDNCPAHVLCWLSKTDNTSALDWRARCQAKIDKPRLFDGAVIEFASEIRFTDGYKGRSFTVAKDKNRLRFKADDSAAYYSISKVRDRSYTVINTPAPRTTVAA